MLIEIRPPSNEAQPQANVWAYTTIPSLVENLLLSSTPIAGELLCRDGLGQWADDLPMLDADSHVHLASIGFHNVVRNFYATTSLAPSEPA